MEPSKLVYVKIFNWSEVLFLILQEQVFIMFLSERFKQERKKIYFLTQTNKTLLERNLKVSQHF